MRMDTDTNLISRQKPLLFQSRGFSQITPFWSMILAYRAFSPVAMMQ